MLAVTLPQQEPEQLLRRFAAVRAETEAICAPLEIEDHVVQPAAFVSPPKWHLAHTTWFFDNFVLTGGAAPRINLLFNSYYKSQGEHWLQQHRGHLSRPTVRQILDYRHAVTEALLELLGSENCTAEQRRLTELGIHHEQQHQELLLMDIKYILGMHPEAPAYDSLSFATAMDAEDSCASHWLQRDEGLREIGTEDGSGFSYDNEGPRHRRWMPAFSLATRLVRNAEYLEFIRDGGYRQAALWLSDGWDWIQQHGIDSPLYWSRLTPEDSGEWQEYHLGGAGPLEPSLPVSHISYYEADAFATWAGARLPTEAELELCAHEAQEQREAAFFSPGAAVCPSPARAADALENGLLWQWTRSAYEAYPGYVPETGALGEYNGKFMSGQQVLRGGCVATPKAHWRPGYRNFYRHTDRWSFTGIRLARDTA